MTTQITLVYMHCSVTEMERKSEEENIKEAETYEEVQNCKEAKSMVIEAVLYMFSIPVL